MIRLRSIARPALLVAGLALLFATFVVGQIWLQSVLLDREFDGARIWGTTLLRWGLFAALTSGVAVLAFRFPLEPGSLTRRVPLHVVAGLLFAALHAVLTAVVFRALRLYPPEDSIGEAIARLLVQYGAGSVVVFSGISAVFHALRYHRDVLQRDRIAAALRARLVESRLEALRAQLNPHFLFNTLNAVSSLAHAGERERVVYTLSRLGDALRVSFDPDLPQEIPLAKEIEMMAPYLDVQQTRFGDRLTVALDVSPDAGEGLFPSMLSQPLIENALRHGIGARPGPGRLRIEGRRVADTLRVRVEDSGPGFAAARGENGIGLQNTSARLKELYGAAHTLECGNLTDGGAFVEVIVPYRTAARAEAP